MQRWGLPEGWVISVRPSHPALVTEEDFIAVQGIRAPRENSGKDRQYRLAGLLRCAICERRLESCWVNSRRVTGAATGIPAPDSARPKNLYIREDRILPHLPALFILLAGTETTAGPRRRRTWRGADVSPPVRDAKAISCLRSRHPGHPAQAAASPG